MPSDVPRSYQPSIPPTIEAELTAERRKLQVVQELSRALSQAMDLDQLLSLMMAELNDVSGAERSTLYLLSDDGKRLWSRVQQGGKSQNIELAMGEGIAGTVAADGETINIRDAYDDPRFQRSVDKASGYRTRSILCIPLHDPKGAVIGVLQLLNKKDGDYFHRADEELLSAIGSQAAIAIERSKLTQALVKKNLDLQAAKAGLQKQTDTLNILFDIEREISAADDLDDLLPRLLAGAVKTLGATSGAIVLQDSDNADLRFRTVLGPAAKVLLGKTVPKGVGVVSWVVENREPALVNRPEEDARFEANFIEEKPGQDRVERPKNIACAPLMVDGAVIGALEVLDKMQAGRKTGFSENDLQVLTVIAGQATRAIELARSKTEKRKQDRLAGIGGMLSGIVHDLKTPMTIISGFAQIMADTEEPGKRRQYVDQIQQQFRLMDGMTKEVLAFARGSSDVLIRKVYLHSFFKKLVEQLSHGFAEQKISIDTDFAYDGVAYFDENAILRLIQNLANNAADEMGEGGVFSMTSAEVDGSLELGFKDTGGGVPKDLEGRIFETFASGKSHGTGLGLAIVKKIVDDHSGQIKYSSNESGTEFFVRLPLTPSQNKQEPSNH